MSHTFQYGLYGIVLENSSIVGCKRLCKYSDFHNILNHLGQGIGLCPVSLDVVLDTSKIILIFLDTYLFAISLVNDISILYVFQP